jgi:hypothetical protein
MPESFGIVEGGSPAGGVVQQSASTGRVTRPDTGIGLLDEQVDQRRVGLDIAGRLDRAAGTSQMGRGLGEPPAGPVARGRSPSPGESPPGTVQGERGCANAGPARTARPSAS